MLQNADHKYQKSPPANGHKGPIWDLRDVHGHGSARAERVRSDVFWRISYSSCSNYNGLGPEDRNDVQSTEQAEILSGRTIVDMGGSQTPMFSHAEEDVDTCLNRSGCYQLRLEVRDGFPSDRILLFVKGKYDLGGVLEMFNWSVGWEESTPNEEDEVHEGPELDCLAVAGALGEFSQTEVEVEAKCDQVGNLLGFEVVGDGRCGHDGVNNAEGEY